jgi:hypothetical protein
MIWQRFIEECERVKRNKTPPEKECDNKRDDSDDNRRSNKKSKFAKSEKSATKSGQKKIRIPVLSIAATARRTPITESAAGS